MAASARSRGRSCYEITWRVRGGVSDSLAGVRGLELGKSLYDTLGRTPWFRTRDFFARTAKGLMGGAEPLSAQLRIPFQPADAIEAGQVAPARAEVFSVRSS